MPLFAFLYSLKSKSMRKNILLFFIFSILLCGCFEKKTKQKDNENNAFIETITIDEKQFKENVDATFLLDTSFVEVILLETNPLCLIGEVTEIFYKNDKIIIYDAKTLGIYLFNFDGTFYSKIHYIGGGPGEYPPRINNVFVTDSYIALLCTEIDKILFYDYEGKYLHSIPTKGATGSAFCTFDNNKFHIMNNWGFIGNNMFGYFCIDAKKGITNKQHPFTEEANKVNRGWGLYSYMSFRDERALAIRSSIDTIYEISRNNEITPRYYVDLVHNKMPREIAEGSSDRAFDSGYSLGVRRVLESDKYMFLCFKGFTAIYDKKENKVVSLGNSLKIPDWGTSLEFAYSSNIQGDYLLIDNLDSHMYEFIDEIIETIANEAPESIFKTKRLDAFKRVKNEEDNTIIYIYKLK